MSDKASKPKSAPIKPKILEVDENHKSKSVKQLLSRQRNAQKARVQSHINSQERMIARGIDRIKQATERLNKVDNDLPKKDKEILKLRKKVRSLQDDIKNNYIRVDKPPIEAEEPQQIPENPQEPAEIPEPALNSLDILKRAIFRNVKAIK